MRNETHYNHSFKAAAKMASLNLGRQAPWYIPENVEACKEQVAWESIGGKMWPCGWFAIVEFTDHDEMRDLGVKQRCERVVAGPYPTEDEALASAEGRFDGVKAELA